MQACKHACNLIVSPSKLVAFVNSKGGVGKSTIAVHYAVAEREKGRRVPHRDEGPEIEPHVSDPIANATQPAAVAAAEPDEDPSEP